MLFKSAITAFYALAMATSAMGAAIDTRQGQEVDAPVSILVATDPCTLL